ncbi:HK97 gp10 family phage protein [Escherichia marmotae]|uniref:HK97 gp10 family phage protein n=1 Tax=Escherichia marmotae TaxID=1499973 RepID=UPI00175533D4|nr:HK97 gp10 family phage protein [Escherichia marmotae]HAI8714156.1 HK97 gp10 family phage protein [Escherichia coli]MEC9626132.1 HK97 gp10 family phage protein [Escherichia marmotae]MED0363730.1 HK97 gp10 family phage protein [Escherichia marmotae]MED8777101.1 HK97 gp10 family phage protein [Escherichia marmotae]MED9200613.1 HK97 gp10 family phage protein [Escherichia marmotae]
MAAKVKGINRAKKRLDQLIDTIQGKKAVRAIYKALYIGGSQATLYTPIDTSTLINSQFRDVRSGKNRVTGRVGYSAGYAMFVHDPQVKQQFRRATAKKEFLKLGFDEMRDQIDRAVAEEMRL